LELLGMGLAAVASLSAPSRDATSIHEHLSQRFGGQQGNSDFSCSTFWGKLVEPLPPQTEPSPTLMREPTRTAADAMESKPTPKLVESSIFVLDPMSLSLSDLRRHLAAFEKRWKDMNGRAITPADAPSLPREVLEMYRAHTKALQMSPEETVRALAQLEAKVAARERVAAEAREAEARAAALAEERWSKWDNEKDQAWAEARAEAWDARAEVAGGTGGSLSGAASWVKPAEEHTETLTREVYLQRMRDSRGITVSQPEEEEEASRPRSSSMDEAGECRERCARVRAQGMREHTVAVVQAKTATEMVAAEEEEERLPLVEDELRSVEGGAVQLSPARPADSDRTKHRPNAPSVEECHLTVDYSASTFWRRPLPAL